MIPELTEEQVRALRDKVYGRPTTDNNWEGCKDKWMTPESIQWLIDMSKKELT